MGVSRVVFVNTTGMFRRYRRYAAEYRRIEEQTVTSGLDYTIIRPTIINDNARDHNIHKLLRIVNRQAAVRVVRSRQALLHEVSELDQLQGVILTVNLQWVDSGSIRCGAKDPLIVFSLSAGCCSQFPRARRRVLPGEPDDSLRVIRVKYREGHEHPDGDAPPALGPGSLHAMPPFGFCGLALYLLPLLDKGSEETALVALGVLRREGSSHRATRCWEARLRSPSLSETWIISMRKSDALSSALDLPGCQHSI